MNVHAGGVAPAQEQTVDLRPAIDKMGTWAQGTRMAVLKALAAGKQDHEIKKECNLNIDVQDYLERKIFNEFGFPKELGHMRRKHAIDAYRAFLARPEPVARPVHAVPHGEPAVAAPPADPVKPNASMKPFVVRPAALLQQAPEGTEGLRQRKYFPQEVLEKGATRIAGLTDLERKVVEALIKHERMMRVSDALGMSIPTLNHHLEEIYRKLRLPPLAGASMMQLESNRDFAIQAYELALARPELTTSAPETPAPAAKKTKGPEQGAEAKRARTASKPPASRPLVDAERAQKLARRISHLTERERKTLLAHVRLAAPEAVMAELELTRSALAQRMSSIYLQFGIGRKDMKLLDRAALLKEAVRIYEAGSSAEPKTEAAAEEPPPAESEAPSPPPPEPVSEAAPSVAKEEFREEDLDRVAREIDAILAPFPLFLLRGLSEGKTVQELRTACGTRFSATSVSTGLSRLRHETLSVPADLTIDDARVFMGAAFLRSKTASIDPNGRVLVTLSASATIAAFDILYPASLNYERKLDELKQAGYEVEVMVLVRRK